MAADIYEYTDAQGRTQRVDDLSKVPPDRLKHMLVIGGEDEPAPGQTAAPSAPAKAPPPQAGPGGIALEVWAVSAFLMTVAVFNKRFMLRLFCGLTAIVWLLYNGYDSFMQSDLARTAEKKPRRASAARQNPAEE